MKKKFKLKQNNIKVTKEQVDYFKKIFNFEIGKYRKHIRWGLEKRGGGEHYNFWYDDSEYTGASIIVDRSNNPYRYKNLINIKEYRDIINEDHKVMVLGLDVDSDVYMWTINPNEDKIEIKRTARMIAKEIRTEIKKFLNYLKNHKKYYVIITDYDTRELIYETHINDWRKVIEEKYNEN